MFAGMENKKTMCIFAIKCNETGEIELSQGLWQDYDKCIEVYNEIWAETHELLQIAEISVDQSGFKMIPFAKWS